MVGIYHMPRVADRCGGHGGSVEKIVLGRLGNPLFYDNFPRQAASWASTCDGAVDP